MQRGALLQIFTRKIDLPGLENLVETDLPQLQLFDTKEHIGKPEIAGQNPYIIASMAFSPNPEAHI